MDLVRIALDRARGQEFEEFVHGFLAATIGARFVPLGGTHDGGADGLVEERIFQNSTRESAFMQASVDKEPKSKIKRTVGRLREFGREPTQLLYVTSQVVPFLDVVEESLSTDLDAVIRIRDGKYLAAQVPAHAGAVAAYYDHLHHQTAFLEGAGRGSVLSVSEHVSDPHVYTYLVGELDRGGSDTSFADGVVDAMIVFALEGTDPDSGVMMGEAEIRDRILQYLPTSEPLLSTRLRQRLEAISKKGHRRIRWHRDQDMWVLPYEDRAELVSASVADELLRVEARQELAGAFAASEMPAGSDGDGLAEMTLMAIQLAFEADGLRFSSFLFEEATVDAGSFVSDAVRTVLDEAGLTGESRLAHADRVSEMLREVFYESTPTQRTLLQRMSRAYGVIFALNGEPRVLKFFDDSMGASRLYVGTDVLISALSERYVIQADQHTRNLLRAAAEAGARLLLTAPVLEEVLAHLRGSDREYLDYLEPVVNTLTFETARQVPKILVRAYLYTQILGSDPKPRAWEEFVNQFCTYGDLHTPAAEIQLRRFLVSQFGMVFEDWDQIKAVCESSRHERLAEALKPLKSAKVLARNDAYMYDMVTQRRRTRAEEKRATEFGYQTWWLSAGEGAAVHAMAQRDGATSRLLMRPGFLAKFIQLAPSASSAREALSGFLPSLLGIRLARRVDENDFHKMLSTMREAESLDDGRRAAKMAECVDKLRGARRSEFDERFAPDSSHDFISIDDLYP